MKGVVFANPQWVHLLWLAAALTAVLVWLDRRGGARLDRFLSLAMQRRLVWRQAPWRRVWCLVCLGGAMAFLVLALMRPQWGFRFVKTPRVGAEMMICLDVSRSMLASDVAPNRLERAKAEIGDLLEFLGRDHVGLIAFSGNASVMCPLTPDFGFLRMVLAQTGSNSVTRGGTNLESPIRKAVAGFRGAADLSRSIILITDGEDHDSFVMDAAKAATERGVRIIAIGIGDEAGSELFVTDPRTGARTRVTDAGGKPVISRLDGDLLREVALETGGVYVPAGTGSLDLQSIYDNHIAPLTRGRLDDRGRLVKQEGFQWMILGALVSLLVASAVAAGRPRPPTGAALSAIAATVVWVGLTLPVYGQASDAAAPPGPSEPVATAGLDQADINPRQVYNEAVSMLGSGRLDAAEKQFLSARRHAGADGVTRYRATYNLGWVEIRRADAVIKDQPNQALDHLQAAIEWFRDAVRLQPQETDPRQNLELTARRALALADALQNRDPVELTQQVDRLIDQQRQLVQQIAGIVEDVGDANESTRSDAVRARFGQLELAQRHILSAAQELALRVRQESDQLEQTDEDERTADQRLRLAQLVAVEAHLYQAVGRIGQGRQQLRQHQAVRAYRRASAGLDGLKRVRDQLRDLSQLLGAVIQDASVLMRQTAWFTAARADVNVTDPSKSQIPPPWLTRPFLGESLATIHKRTGEVLGRVEAGVRQEDPQPPSDSDQQDPPVNPELVALLQEARPLVRQAEQDMLQAGESLASGDDLKSYPLLASATVGLIKARELFLDVKGLVEMIYTDQRRLAGVMGQVFQAQLELEEVLPMIGGLQKANVTRADRLAGLIQKQLQAVSEAPKDDQDSEESGRDPKQTFELADRLLSQVKTTFGQIVTMTDRVGQADEPAGMIDPLKEQFDQSVKEVEALRRLFMTVIEHLRQAAQKQTQLADETRDVAAKTSEGSQGPVEFLGPLSSRQQDLAAWSEQIASALRDQAQQDPQSIATGDPDKDAAQARASQETAHRLIQAADRVDEAKQVMDLTADQMQTPPADVQDIQDNQSTAVEHLTAALALLSPPEDQDQQQKKDQQDPQQGQDGKPQEQQGQAQPESDQDGAKQDQTASQKINAAQLLQAVRDRQAQRQQQKRQKQPAGYAPVDKDW